MLEPHRNNYNRRSPMYSRITLIPGVLYLNISRSGGPLSFGQSGGVRASVIPRGARINKSIGGFNIGKTFSFSKIARLFGLGNKNNR